ncbi:MAG: hypothetical protein ACTHMJ_01095 [Thermomicrobiales bacterium]
MATPSPESWRVVLFTDQVFIVNFYKDFLTAHGHRLVGLVTSAKRNRSYLDVSVRRAPGWTFSCRSTRAAGGRWSPRCVPTS